MQRQVLNTKDGSSTIYVPDLQEHYHSINGAVQESMHVFIEAGMLHISSETIRVFEMGFGTGLNCLLTLLHAKNKIIEYVSVEKYPVEQNMARQLNYVKNLNLNNRESSVYLSMHKSPWDEWIDLAPNFKLFKSQSDICNYKHLYDYNLVFFDAFAPDVQPNLWEEAIFLDLYNAMLDDGVLTTYCAKGIVRRRLQSCGFRVERLPGPPGKREILRATKKSVY